jgi:hypothetical protein
MHWSEGLTGVTSDGVGIQDANGGGGGGGGGQRGHSEEGSNQKDASEVLRVRPLAWLKWCTHCRCLRKHFKCHFLQIELNNRTWFLHMLQQSIKVSLVAASVQQLTYLDIDGLKIVKFYEHPEISAQSRKVPGSCQLHHTIRGNEG